MQKLYRSRQKDKAYTGRREEQKKGRLQTLYKIQKGTGTCNANTEMRRKTGRAETCNADA